jgi:hypothetical protein
MSDHRGQYSSYERSQSSSERSEGAHFLIVKQAMGTFFPLYPLPFYIQKLILQLLKISQKNVPYERS